MAVIEDSTHTGGFLVPEGKAAGLSREVVTVVAGAGIIKPGLVLGQINATRKFKPYIGSANHGSQIARAIAYTECNAASADANLLVIHRDAEVRLSSLCWVEGNTIEDMLAALSALANHGIVAR